MNKTTKISYALILTLISTSALLATPSSPDSAAQNADNKDKNASIIPPVNKDIVQGRWGELKGRIKEKWGELTDNDLLAAEGALEKLAGILQAKYGYEKARAEKEVNEFLKLNNIDINEYNKAKEKPKAP